MDEFKNYNEMTPKEFFEATKNDEPYEFLKKCQERLSYIESKIRKENGL